MVPFRFVSWFKRSLGLRPRLRRIRRRKIAGLHPGALPSRVVILENRVLLAGTPTQIADSNSDTRFQNESSNPTEFTQVGGLTFFTYNTTETDKPVLGFTDGTTGGTTFVDFRFSPGTRLTDLTEYNGSLYFFANGVEFINNQWQTRGNELWKHDPVAGTTTLVKDIVGEVANPASTSGVKNEGSNGAGLIKVGGKLYFSASDDITGAGGNRELWESDGTEVGTVKVAEINPGSESSNPTQFTDVNGILYFVATSGPATGNELWKHDPGAGTTELVLDVRPGIQDSQITELTAVGTSVFFSASDGVNGFELWTSDGTAGGTFMVRDVQPGIQGSNPQSLVNLNGTLYFSADDGTVGREIWKSDGTQFGTVLIRDIAQTGPNGTIDVKQNSIPSNLTAFNNKVYFSANDGLTGDELWVTDGTFLGTYRVANINTELTSSGDSDKSSFPGSLTVLGNNLYFIATNTFSQFGETNFELYRMDTSEVVAQVREINTLPSFLQTSPFQYFKSNGDSFLATSPTFVPGGNRTNFSYDQLFVSNGRLYFSADNGINGGTGYRGSSFNTFGEYAPNFEIWTSDGTAGGTIQLDDLTVPQNLSSNPTKLTTVPDPSDSDRARVYFTYQDPKTGRFNLAFTQTSIDEPAIGAEPGRQGTTYDVGVSFAADISNPVAMGGRLYFFANNGVNGNELWTTDGTVTGTFMVIDLRAGGNGSNGQQLVATTDRLFWIAESGANNLELYTSTGAAGNATALTSIAGTPNFQDLTVVGARVYFTAFDPTPATMTLPAIQRRLWFSDGTAANTRIVVSTAAAAVPGNPTGPFGPLNPDNLVALNGQLFFSANNTIFRTNGTDAGTIPLPASPAGLTNLANFTAVEGNDRLYFTATNAADGNELWTSNFDGTSVQLASNIAPGAASSNPQNLTAVNSVLYFTADDGTIGRELYRASGATSALVLDINPGAASSSPQNLIAAGTSGNLFFSATNGANGVELWRANGLAATQHADINPGAASSSPASFAFASNQVYFASDDGVNGRELWRNGGVNGGLTGVTLVRDIGLLTTADADIRNFVVTGGNVYYIATTGPNVSGIFRTNSDAGATQIATFSDGRLLTDTNIAATLTNPFAQNGQYLATDMVAIGSTLYVAAATGLVDGSSNLFSAELYAVTNITGQPASVTVNLLGDIRVGANGNSSPSFLTVLGGQVLFAANDGTNTGLWSSSGGAPTLISSSPNTPRFMTTIGNRVYFTAGPANARTAWVTDGTAAGTVQLSTAIVDESLGDGEIFKQAGNRVFFSANGGQGRELWSTTGTAASTAQVKDINPGAAGSNISGMIGVNGILYFGANDGVHGTELWQSDGTSAGTFMLLDIEFGPVGSNPGNFAIANNSTDNIAGQVNGTPTVLFAATTSLFGRELWQTGGLTGDTIIVKDISPGVRSSNPSNLTSLDGTVYFAADDGVSGNTLWRSIGVDQITGNTLTVRVKQDGTLAQSPGVLRSDDVGGIRNPAQFVKLELASQTLTRLFFSGETDSGGNETLELDINHTPIDLTFSPGSVAENQPVGTVVGVMNTVDPDAGDTFQYQLVEGAGDDDNALFQIVGTSLQTLGPFDFETKNSYTVRVRTTDQRGQFIERSLTINVTDVNEAPTGLFVQNAVTSIPENTATPILLGNLKEIDDALQLTNLFSLSNGSAGNAADFEIIVDQFAGPQLWLKAGVILDYEVKNQYVVDISVYDPTLGASPASPNATITFTLNITDVDEFDTTPISDLNPAVEVLDENVPIGTLVGITAFAEDPDGTAVITYSLDNSAGGLFTVNPTTGVVTTAAAINREAPNTPTHTIRVRASSTDGSFSIRDFVITINDIDEFDVSPIVDTDAAADAVNENSPIGTTVGITANSVDGDATNSTVSYSLDDNAGGLFAIDPVTGVVTTAALIDRENPNVGSYNITVRATSLDTSTTTKVFTISIIDIDEFDATPIIDTNAVVDAVDENSPIGTTVGVTAFSVDSDATTNVITYSLDNSAGGLFAIDPSTGVVTTAALIDRENPNIGSYDITVRATSQDGSTVTKVFTIVINDIDEFDATPIVDTNATVDAVDENSPIGTTVGITAFSVDGDATTNVITYTLDDNAGGLFAVDPVTGVVTTAALINRESPNVGSYNITVRATSQDTSTVTRVFTVVINDIDEFDASPIVDTNAAVDAVDENSPIGTTVGVTAFSEDLDATTNVITYSLDNSAGGLFAIDPATGVVTTAALIDRENPNIGSYDITVRATSQDGSTVTKVFTIVINDVDEFDVTPIVDTNAAVDALDENSPNGSLVGITAFSQDLDATTSVVTYSLDDNAGGRFTINPSTGVVTVADSSLLNFEVNQSHDITVRATSQDGSTVTKVFTISLNDVDEFDITPIVDSDLATADAVDENSPNGTYVGLTAFAEDLDGTTNVVTYSLIDDAGGRFAIDPVTGQVTVADTTLIDREISGSHSITVLAVSQDGSFSLATFDIAINDVDEFNVTIVVDTDPAPNQVFEHSPIGTPIGITGFSVDADATNSNVTYSLAADANGRFGIDPVTGVVFVTNPAWIDREQGPTWSISVRATSEDGSFTQTPFSVLLLDVDEFDVGPVMDSDPAPNLVMEQSPNGTPVGITALAIDKDATTNTVTYALTANAGGRFAIDPNTGVITVANGALLDREQGPAWSVTILATSVDGSSRLGSFTIYLDDLNEAPIGPVSDSNGAVNAVNENAANGTTVGLTALAVDFDATSIITYALTDDAGGRFKIDSSSGVVTVANGTLLDREVAASHSVTIMATSSDGSSSSQTFVISVNDVDEFDITPVGNIGSGVLEVLENAPIGTTVGITAFAIDHDATNNTVTYSLANSAGGRFGINPLTGVVTVANPALLDREAAASHNIVVRATSADGSSSTAAFTINLIDVNDNPVTAIIDNNPAVNQVIEKAPTGTLVGITALAMDADVTNNGITYSLQDTSAGRYKIDPVTGVVTVDDGTRIDFEDGTTNIIIVKATSQDGTFRTQSFVINVLDAAEDPVITLSNNTIAENLAANSVVGAFGVDNATPTSPVFTLVPGAGATNNASFQIVGNLLRTASSFNFEAKNSFSIRVRMTSSNGVTAEQVFTINISNVNEAPTNVTLSNTSVSRNAPVGTIVGTLSGVDPDAGAVLNFSLVGGSGSTNNASFTIVGNQLRVNGPLSGRRASIRVRVTDQFGLSFERVFSLRLTR